MKTESCYAITEPLISPHKDLHVISVVVGEGGLWWWWWGVWGVHSSKLWLNSCVMQDGSSPPAPTAEEEEVFTSFKRLIFFTLSCTLTKESLWVPDWEAFLFRSLHFFRSVWRLLQLKTFDSSITSWRQKLLTRTFEWKRLYPRF